jgi:hypothetical protein
VIRARSAESRFQALHASGLTALGREEESELLRRRWSRAKQAKAKWYCSPARPGLGNHGSRRRGLERLTQGFDTLDLNEAKAFLEDSAPEDFWVGNGREQTASGGQFRH